MAQQPISSRSFQQCCCIAAWARLEFSDAGALKGYPSPPPSSLRQREQGMCHAYTKLAAQLDNASAASTTMEALLQHAFLTWMAGYSSAPRAIVPKVKRMTGTSPCAYITAVVSEATKLHQQWPCNADMLAAPAAPANAAQPSRTS